jgi:molybdate transport system permease protein
VSTPAAAPPRALFLPAALALLLLVSPLVALLVRVPWSDAAELFTSPVVVDALVLSLVCSSISTVICLVLGVPLAAVLARARGRWAALGRALVTVPLVLPPVVGGVALLAAFGRRGLLGAPLETATGITLPFSTAGVIVAETFVALPFLVVTVEGALRQRNTRFEETAAVLGAGPWTTFRRVTLPLVAPGLAAGTLLAWARALGEFGATITFAGSLQGRTQTMPLAVYLSLETDPGAALALGVLLLAVSVLVLFALRDRWWVRA